MATVTGNVTSTAVKDDIIVWLSEACPTNELARWRQRLRREASVETAGQTVRD